MLIDRLFSNGKILLSTSITYPNFMVNEPFLWELELGDTKNRQETFPQTHFGSLLGSTELLENKHFPTHTKKNYQNYSVSIQVTIN